MTVFLTFFVMVPTIDFISRDSIKPYLNKEINFGEALKRAEMPIKTFMLKHTRQKDIALFLNMSKDKKPEKIEDLSIRVLVPAFAISELKSAFEMGFLLFLPFLIIDLVVASILLSMGIMMLPPPLISLPFKLLLFVLVDGWNLITGSLVRSFQ
jgi:flagellar biosynthetic protein FliP